MERRSGNVCSLLQLHLLPIEVIDIILVHSSIKDMLNWRLTSKYWFNIINRSSEFKNRVQLKITNENCDDVMNCTRDYFNIRILDARPFEESTPVLEQFKPVLEKFAPKIRRLNISSDDMVQIHFPKLLELVVSGALFGRLLPENLNYMLTVHASQIEAIQLYLAGVKIINQVMRMLPNLRVLDFLTWERSTQSVDAVSESIIALRMLQNIDCLSSVPNLRKLGVGFLDHSIVQKCFQHLKLEVVEYCCIYDSNTQHIDMTGFKRELLSKYNFDFVKENKRNVKFVQKKFGTEFKFDKYDLSFKYIDNN